MLVRVINQYLISHYQYVINFDGVCLSSHNKNRAAGSGRPFVGASGYYYERFLINTAVVCPYLHVFILGIEFAHKSLDFSVRK